MSEILFALPILSADRASCSSMGPSLTVEVDQLIIVAYDPHLTYH